MAPLTPDPASHLVYVSTVQGAAIKGLIECLRDIVYDCSVTFDNTGIRISTLDGARCSMVYAKLTQESFESFFCPAPFECGVSLQNLFKLLRSTGSGDALTLWVDKAAPALLHLELSNDERRARSTFTYKLLDVDSETLKLPQTEFDCVFTLPSILIQRLARDMGALSDTISISADRACITFSCNGDFAQQVTQLSTHDAATGVSCVQGVDATVVPSRFLAKYIQLFTKASSLSSTVSLFLKSDYPLVLEYACGGLGRLRFILAPKAGD